VNADDLKEVTTAKYQRQASELFKAHGDKGALLWTEHDENRRAAHEQFMLKWGQAKATFIPALPTLRRDRATDATVPIAEQALAIVEATPELTAIMERSGFDAAWMEWQRQVDRLQWQLFTRRKARASDDENNTLDRYLLKKAGTLAVEEPPETPVDERLPGSAEPMKSWLKSAVETLPPVQWKLMEMVPEYLPDGKPGAYDARRLKDPSKLRRTSGIPENKIYRELGQAYDALEEQARCKRYAVAQGLDYADGKPFTTPKPFNRLAHLLERRPFAGRPMGQTLPVHKIIKSLELGDATLTTKWKMVHREEPTEPGLTPREREDRMYTDFETQLKIVSDVLKPKMLQKGAWSWHHINVGHVISTCGEYVEDALLMLYGWMDRRAEAKKSAFEVKHPLTQWPTAWLTRGEERMTRCSSEYAKACGERIFKGFNMMGQTPNSPANG
jgi:hypothetical protein